MNKTYAEKRLNQLPSWLWANSATLPPVYKIVWETVREDQDRPNGLQTEVLVDTNKVFPLLLTSQLSTEVLGHIWNLANKKYAGQLTEQELYIVLALVAAAQASYTFNSLDILHLLPFPPIPYLNVECILNMQTTMQASTDCKVQSIEKSYINFNGSDGKHMFDAKGKAKVNQFGTVSSDINTSQTNFISSRNYLDFKGHSSDTVNSDANNLFRDIKQPIRVQTDIKHTSPVIDPCDDFSDFQSAPIPSVQSVPIWDTKQGSAIGSRLANHNLGVKKSIEKSRKNNLSCKVIHVNNQPHNSSVSQNSLSQSKEQSSVECFSELFPKCSVKNQSNTVILKDTAIRSDTLKESDNNAKDYSNVPIETPYQSTEKNVTSVEFSEKVDVAEKSEVNQQDLMSLQPNEDKYSALRALIQETPAISEIDSSSNNCTTAADEFGDFVSAEQIATNVPRFNTLDSDNFVDLFTDFELKPHNNNENNTTEFSLIANISQSLDNLQFDDNADERSMVDEKFESVVETGKVPQKEDTISINSGELNSGIPGALTRSGSVPSLDLKSFLPTNTEEDQTVETPQQSGYWEWKQYMESCVLLLQVAANIFTNITSEVILNEVLNSVQGYNFLCNLAEVAAVCRRVNFSYKEMDINILGFDNLLMDIDKIWAEMEPFYAKIPIVTELPAWPLHRGECTSCALCLTIITSDGITYNENNYHITCANLWLNCVNNQLPAMRYPTHYSHANLCTGNHI